MSSVFSRLGKALRASSRPGYSPDEFQENLFQEQEQNAYASRGRTEDRQEADLTEDVRTEDARPEDDRAVAARPKTLIIWFSRRGENYVNGQVTRLEKGNTEIIVDYIRNAVPADTFEVVPEQEYPADYLECTRVAKREQKEKARPALRSYLEDLDEYENIVIAAPCWWGNWPCPMMTQLERLDFNGKKVYPVMTHEGSGFGKSIRTLRKTCRGAEVRRGLEVHGAEAPGAEAPVQIWALANLR